MERKYYTNDDIANFLLNDMEVGTERTIMGIDGMADGVMPDLAMGVIKEKFFDTNTTTYLVGVYGSDCDFHSFFGGNYDEEKDCVNDVVRWLESTAMAMCGGNYGGLYVKPTDEEQQAEYEENKYNGEIVRTIDTLEWGEVDLVARFDVDEGNFYDCYQKETRGYLGELHTENLDALSDKEIEDDLVEDMQTGW